MVWVGERIALTCSLDILIDGITNCQWTVPGIRIANWAVGHIVSNNIMIARDGYARTTPLTNLNESAVTFYWVQDTASAVVQCTVQVGGETLTAKTTYEVRRPVANWDLNPVGSPVRVTNTCGPVAPEYAGYYHLTTGLKLNTNTVGMYYSYEITDFKGFTNDYSVSMVQTVVIKTEANLEDPTPQAQSWTTGWLSGLDTEYPYVPWGRNSKTNINDTPQSVLLDIDRYYWRDDKFWSYLMWQPKRRPNSIPVPLKLGIWDWRGAAQKLDRNTPPTWKLNGWTNPQGGTGFDYMIHPTWGTNINGQLLLDARTTNNYAYPTP